MAVTLSTHLTTFLTKAVEVNIAKGPHSAIVTYRWGTHSDTLGKFTRGRWKKVSGVWKHSDLNFS
jgi:hypothetical protein